MGDSQTKLSGAQCEAGKHVESSATADARMPVADEKITVDVMAEDATGTNTMSFSMKVTTGFEKMMLAWCEHHGIPLKDVRFEGPGGLEVQVQHTPERLGWSASRGKLLIQAVPADALVEARTPTGVAPSSAADLATVPGTPLHALEMTKAKSDIEAAEPAPKVAVSTASSRMPVANEKITVDVLAEDASGPNAMSFSMKVTTVFEKMMLAWCGHH